ncbi:MAG TPA: S8 family serine peptidase [Thermoanaerobaculia bacterium]|jgi:hypothetical protein|nr:S8 family serine peptidase [Thermoanaerobaculia bacterium]
MHAFLRLHRSLIATVLFIAVCASPLYAAVRRVKEPVPGRYIVVFRESVKDVDGTAREVAQRYHGRLLDVWTEAVRGAYFQMTESDAARLSRDPRVATVEEDAFIHDSQDTGSNSIAGSPNTDFRTQADPLWHLTQIANRDSAESISRLGQTAKQEYQEPQTGAGVTIYMIDSGVVDDHPELSGAIITHEAGDGAKAYEPAQNPQGAAAIYPGIAADPIRPEVDPISPDRPSVPCGARSKLKSNPLDGMGAHGTAVAGFIVGSRTGVAKGAKLVSVKITSCADGTSARSAAMLLSGFEWVFAHATRPISANPAVVTVSHFQLADGATCSGQHCVSGPELSAFDSAIVKLLQAGIPVVSSANNNTRDACTDTPGRLSRRGNRNPGGVINVGGTTWENKVWERSNRGQCVDIWAPAADLSVVDALAGRLFITPVPPSNPTDDRASGTSYAAPMVAGVIARMMQEDPSLYATPSQTVENVWKRLEANATKIAIPHNGDPLLVTSPDLLLYMAGVTLTKALTVEGVAPSAKLTVDALGSGITYKWYRNDELSSFAQTSTGELTVNQAGTYRARLERGAYWAETNGVVVAATPPDLTVLRHPAPVWVKDSEQATLTAILSRSPFSAHWWSYTTSTEKLATYDSASGEHRHTTADTGDPSVDTLALRALPCANCPLVETNAAEIRRCLSLTSKQLTHSEKYDPYDSSEHQALVAPPELSFIWLYRRTPDSLPQPFIDPTNPQAYGFYERRARLEPPAKGYYSVRASNACSTYTTNEIHIKERCVHDLVIAFVNGTTAHHTLNAATRDKTATASVPANNEAHLSVSVLPAGNYRVVWKEGPVVFADYLLDSNSPATFTTPPVGIARTFTAEVTDTSPESGCVRRMIFQLTPVGAPSCDVTVSPATPPILPWNRSSFSIDVTLNPQKCRPLQAVENADWISISDDINSTTGNGRFTVTAEENPDLVMRQWTITIAGQPIVIKQEARPSSCPRTFHLTAGLCTTSQEPVYRLAPGKQVTISPVLRNSETGAVILDSDQTSEEFEFSWSGAVQSTGRSILYTMPSTNTKIFLTVTRKSKPCDSDDIEITIEPIGPACTSNCAVSSCRRRAVRSSGVASHTVTFQPGQTLSLLPPDDVQAVSYAWYRSAPSGSEMFDETAEVSVTPTTDTRYWVHVNYGSFVEESDELYALANTPLPDVAATPRVQVIQAGGVADLNVALPANYVARKFEWRMGDPANTNNPIVGGQQRLTRSNMQDDASFWCYVTNDSTGQVDVTNVANVVVTCTDSIFGTVSAWPGNGYISRTDRAWVQTSATGKLAGYEWYARLPGQTTGTLIAPYGMSAWISPSQPITYYSVVVRDSCGNTVTIGETPVYLCVPTIDTQPENKIVPAGSAATLSIAASPAIAGQPLTIKWFASSDPYEQNPLGQGPVFVTPPIPAGTTQTYYATVSADCSGTPRGVRSEFVTATACTNPAISTMTQSPVSVRAGSSTTLSVTPSGDNLTYQWYTGTPGDTTAPIEGATESYVPVAPTTNTTYWVRILSDGVCSIDSPGIAVEPCTDPLITAQPVPVTIRSGDPTTLAVTTSITDVTYQWYNANTADPIAGATSSTLTVTPSVDTQYYVRIKHGACMTQSNTVKVTVCALTANLTGGKNTTYQEWATLTLSLSNSRVPAADAHYTWYKGTGASSTIFNSGTGMTQRADNPATTTQYWVRVNDGTCTYDSNVVTINVCIPTITAQPVATLIQPNQTATLSVSTTNIAGQTYRWYIGAPGDVSQPAAGASATTSTYTTPVLSATASYWVRVTGPCGAAQDSAAAIVTVCTPATITSITPTRYVKAGTPAIHQVYASGSSLTYQWYVGAPGITTSPIEGATADYLTVTPTTNTTYWARVWTDGLCTKDSGVMAVDVCTNPVITTQPAPVTIRTGSPATLTVATSTSGVSYQWYNAGTADPIPGATSPTLTVTPSVDTQYYVRITRNACTVQSNTVTVTVCALTANLTGGKNTTYQEWATLTVTLSSSRVPAANAHYTWYRGTGANSTVFNSGTGMTQRADNPATTTQYWVRVNDGTCSYDSNVVTITVCIPQITAQPQGALIQQNQVATMSVGTTNIAGQTFRWYIGAPGNMAQPAPGASATTSTYTTPALTSTTSYWVRVSGPCGNVADSAAAVVTVCTPAAISSVTPTRFIKAGSSTWHQVYATGSNLTYQWYVGSPGTTSNPIAGATLDSINVSPTTTTTYWARVWTDGLCTKDSTAMVVDVCTDPPITTQPASTTINSGQSTTLTVATSASGVSYQWYSGTGTLISGATTASLTVTPSADTNYFCKLTRNACSINSATATVKVCTLAASISGGISTSAGQQVLLTASAVNLRVSADAAMYTWYRGTGSNATVFAAGTGVRQRYDNPATTTDYWVRISDGTCSADSATTRITVCIPTINAQPQGSNINRGQSTSLSVSATGASSYQWYIGAPGDMTQPVPGGTTPTISVAPLTTTTYWVRVIGCTTVNSVAATVDVCQSAAITGGPYENGIRPPGAWATVWVTATGGGLTYQWYVGQSGDMSVPLSGATGDMYQFQIQESRYYWVRIAAACGPAVNSAAIFHSANPKITQQPVSTTVPPNGTATLSVTATGTYLAYQWYRGNSGDLTNPISGATAASYTTPPITTATNYWCKVTSGQGLTYTTHATVGLCTGPNVRDLQAQYNGSNYWWLTVRLWSGDVGSMHYHYYAGVPGNVAQSVFKGSANSWRNVLATQQETWWVRVWLNDNSCYTDTNGVTIYPVQ